jgi:glycosyltransferase involved in cell wall biosynthesis
MNPRIALVVSHPIQHFCPQYVSFAQNTHVVFKVFFASTLGLQKYVDPNFKQEISWGNLRLDQFDHTFLNGDALLPSDKNIDAPSLDENLETFKPNLVIIYGYFQKLQRRAHQWALAHHVKLAYISDSELRHKRNPLKRIAQLFLLRRFFRGIDFFLSVGDANEEFYKKHGVPSSKLLRMHFPIDVLSYQEKRSQAQSLGVKIRDQYGIGHSEMVLTVVGKLVAWKNQDHVFEAMRYLEQAGVRTHLFVIGSGPMQDAWKAKDSQLKSSKIHFTGFVSIEELPAYYAATDIYVHPASMEPHSIAVSEAIFMGCPVVLSDTCGSYGESDDVQPGKNGFVYPFGDTRALAEKLKLLIEDGALRKKFSDHSYRMAELYQQSAHTGILSKLQNILEKSTR